MNSRNTSRARWAPFRARLKRVPIQHVILFGILTLAVTSCVRARNHGMAELDLPSQDWVEIEVRYPGGEAGKEVEAFLVRPREAGPFPCTVLLHGRGGWWQAYIRSAREMAARGFSALIMNYYSAHRVNLEGLNIPFEHRKRQFELQILDISSATRAFARSRNCTGGQVGLIGFSLGADKAFRVAAVNPEVRAIVSYYGPSDYVSLIRERINPLLLALADDETLRWKGYLEKNSPLALAPRVGAAVLLFHGVKDGVIQMNHSVTMYNALRKRGRGKIARLKLYEGVGHNFVLRRAIGPERADSIRHTLAFLREALPAPAVKKSASAQKAAPRL